MGNKVRWNNSTRHYPELHQWAQDKGIELVPVCPENELFGTPRQNIRLVQVGDSVEGRMGKEEVYKQMIKKSRELFSRHPDARGFIGLANSPSCGISVGVKNRGSVMKGTMHLTSPVPSCEANQLRTEEGRQKFLNRVLKHHASVAQLDRASAF
tara:strand:- start:2384 stop:2845 length:462 start_codon:yes stop_codon:yes gene_type:complete